MNENQYFIVKYTHHSWQPIHSCEFKTGIETEALSRDVKQTNKKKQDSESEEFCEIRLNNCNYQ